MIARSSSGRSRLPNTGFTLVEMLAVMGIIAILLVMVKPAMTSLTRGQSFTANVYDVDYLVRQAKATAMAQNTFVWLGFRSTNTDGTPLVVNGAPAMVVAMVVSRSGLSSAVPSTASPAPYQLAVKPMILQNVQLDSTGNPGLAAGQGQTPSPSAYKNLVGFDSIYNDDIGGISPSPSSYPYPFSLVVPGIIVPGITNAISFTAVVAFSPDGAASLGTTTAARTIGIGLKVMPVSATNAQVAAIQISGLNGRSTIFQQ